MILDFDKTLKLSGFPVDKAIKIFKNALETDKTTWQNEKKWEIFKYHYNNNQFYRNFAGKEYDEWNDIPVLHPHNLKGDFLSKIPEELTHQRHYKSSTSGSSGNPLVFEHDKLTHALVWENVRHIYNQTGISIDDRQARMFGTSKKPLDMFIAHLKDAVANRHRFDVLDLSDEALKHWVKHFRKEKFIYIYGYTNALVVFAHYLINQNYTLKSVAPSLKCCIITSEMCTDIDTQIMQKGFGIPVYNEYGSSELGIMGFKEKDYWTCSDELIYFEVLDENDIPLPDGDVGVLTCTSLFNRATPFIRYQLGDLAAIKRVDGRTIITKLMGRQNDLAILPSGRKVPGIAFYFVVQNIVEEFCNIKEYLFRQTSEGFNFEYVADQPINNEIFTKIKNTVILHLKEEIKLTALKMNELQHGKNGKFKQFIYSV